MWPLTDEGKQTQGLTACLYYHPEKRSIRSYGTDTANVFAKKNTEVNVLAWEIVYKLQKNFEEKTFVG
jgi:hypothetical protein